jgi:hypothetical protein
MADPGIGFLPWVRSGLASMAQAAPSQNFVSLQVVVTVNTIPSDPVTVRLFGPGQVTGIDPRAISRMEPLPNTTNFEPNYFPAVEFATPDFPWVFSPAVASSAGLRPWICLVVVKEQAGVSLTPRPNALPLLRFTPPAAPLDELPDLDEIAYWAHAQIAGAALANDCTVRAALADPNGAAISRLICPRKLDPDTRYLACLVPTYHAGVQAGISPDLPDDDGDLAPAWTATTTAPFDLPVYASWRFGTSDAGDFASLAHRIHPPPSSPPFDVGQLPMDESAPEFGLPPFPGLKLSLEGALRTLRTMSTPWPDGVQGKFEQALVPILMPPTGPDPIVAPPIYGEWPAATTIVPAAGSPPVWLRELNLDPRMRAAAGIGVNVVRADQDNLMASAWDQFEALRQANQRLRLFQLARVVTQSLLTQHINAVEGSTTFFQLTRPLHARVRLTLGSTATLDAHLAASRITSGAVSASFRRLVRRRGPLGRRLFAAAAPPSQIIERLNQATGTPSALTIVAQRVAPTGTVLLDSVSSQTVSASLTGAAVAAAPGWRLPPVPPAPPGSPAPPPPPPQPPIRRDDPDAPVWLQTGVETFPPAPEISLLQGFYVQTEAQFRAAATQLVAYISQNTAKIVDAPKEPLFFGTLAAAQAMVATAVDPTATLVARAAAQLDLPTSGDPLGPRLGAPQFPRPMSRALTPQQLLPGVENVPDDIAAALVTNPRFIEAYMIGLNDEMRRELAWRQYPVDPSATFFTNFWGEAADIPPIATWNGANSLGANTDTHEVVLLIRGELLRRYPNAVITAVDKLQDLGTSELLPIFRGTIDPDMTFFGFAPDTAKPGSYFVVSEHPSEPRFGLEPAPPKDGVKTWNDLNWPQATEAKAVAHNHLSATAQLSVPTPKDAQWGANAAQQAYITYRPPNRVAWLASKLLGPG